MKKINVSKYIKEAGFLDFVVFLVLEFMVIYFSGFFVINIYLRSIISALGLLVISYAMASLRGGHGDDGAGDG